MTLGYSPGPWGRGAYGSLVDAEGETVVFAGSGLSLGTAYRDDPRSPRMLANTRLLEVAPEMYALLQRVERCSVRLGSLTGELRALSDDVSALLERMEAK